MRDERAATVSNALEETNKQKRHKTSQGFHRPHASHHLSIHRYPAKEGVQQLGADIVNFLNPARSTTNSANPSETAFKETAEGQRASLDSTASDPDVKRKKLVKPSSAPNSEVVQAYSKAASQKLDQVYEALSQRALSESRQVDIDMMKIQDGMNAVRAHTKTLRCILDKTKADLESVRNKTLPSFGTQHTTRILALESVYDKLEVEKIGGLEKRLTASRQRLEIMKQRMQKVAKEVGDCELRDAVEFRRSKRRHAIFWSIIGIVVLILIVLIKPKMIEMPASTLPSYNPSGLKDVRENRFQNSEDIGQTRLEAQAIRAATGDYRLKVFDEL